MNNSRLLTFDGRSLKAASGIQGLNDAYYSSRLEADTFTNLAVVNGMSPLRAYQTVSWLHRAVSLKVNAIQDFPFDLEREGRPDVDVSEAPEYAALMKGFRRLLYLTAVSRTVLGAAYWYVRTDARGRVTALEFLLPGDVQPREMGGKLAWFDYTGMDTDVPRQIGLDRMVWFWAPSLSSKSQPGPGDGQVVLAAASMLWALDAFAAGFFNSGGVKVTVFEIPPATPEDERLRFQNFLNRAMSGVRNAFRNLAVRLSIKATVIGSDIKDTQATELMLAQRDSVAAGIGIPPGLISGDNENYATAQVNFLLMYTGCVIPAFNELVEAMNDKLFSLLGLKVVPHKERLEVMQTALLEQAQAVATVCGGPVLTVDEGRALLGYEPMPESEKPKPPVVMVAAPKDEDEVADADEAGDDEEPIDEAEAAEAKAARAARAVAQFDAMLRTLSEQRRAALVAVRDGRPLPVGPDRRINAALRTAHTPAEVRAVFERHWPRKPGEGAAEGVQDLAALTEAIREATAALRETA